MKITKVLFSLFAIFFTCASYALTFTAGLGKNGELLEYSNCEMKDWGSERVLPGRPSSNDKIRIIGNNTLELDTEVNVGLLDIWAPANVAAKNKNNLRIGKEFQIIVGGSGNASGLTLKNSKMTINGTIRIRCHGGTRQLGKGFISLDNSSLLVKRNLTSWFPIDGNAGFFKNNGKRGGVELKLVGKSSMEVDGGVVHDSIIKENPKDGMYKIILTEENGNVPAIKFAKMSNIAPADIEINVKSPLAKGVYCLIELESRKDSMKTVRSLTLNGKPAAFGDSFALGDKTATLKIAPTKSPSSKDKQTANDLVLEVK